MPKRIDVEPGTRYGRWTVLEECGPKVYPSTTLRQYWCRCNCGNEAAVVVGSLRSGKSTSCGCFNREVTIRRSTTHGQNRTRLHLIWLSMRGRCSHRGNSGFPWYGERGIKVCPEWEASFVAFQEWAKQSGYTEELTLERIDVNGNYEPSNCTWIRLSRQTRNTRANRMLIAFGETKCLADWVDDSRCKVTRTSLQTRLRFGWDEERAISTPPTR